MNATSLCVILLCATLASPAWGTSDCGRLLRDAQAKEVQLYPRAVYRVKGKGRLYFHSAPDKRCRSTDVFVVPGDTMAAYTERDANR